MVFPAFNIIWDCFGLDFWFLKFLIVFIIKTLIQILSVIMNGVWSRGSTYGRICNVTYLIKGSCSAVGCHHALVLCTGIYIYIFISSPISLHKKTWLLLSLLWITQMGNFIISLSRFFLWIVLIFFGGWGVGGPRGEGGTGMEFDTEGY